MLESAAKPYRASARSSQKKYRARPSEPRLGLPPSAGYSAPIVPSSSNESSCNGCRMFTCPSRAPEQDC